MLLRNECDSVYFHTALKHDMFIANFQIIKHKTKAEHTSSVDWVIKRKVFMEISTGTGKMRYARTKSRAYANKLSRAKWIYYIFSDLCHILP